MRKFLLLPIVLAGCASQPSIAPVSTPQDWERWLQIGPNCRRYAQQFCLAATEKTPVAGTFQIAARSVDGLASK